MGGTHNDRELERYRRDLSIKLVDAYKLGVEKTSCEKKNVGGGVLSCLGYYLGIIYSEYDLVAVHGMSDVKYEAYVRRYRCIINSRVRKGMQQ